MEGVNQMLDITKPNKTKWFYDQTWNRIATKSGDDIVSVLELDNLQKDDIDNIIINVNYLIDIVVILSDAIEKKDELIDDLIEELSKLAQKTDALDNAIMVNEVSE